MADTHDATKDIGAAGGADSGDALLRRLGEIKTPALPQSFREWLLAFPSSGLFFMLIGGVILWLAYDTMGIAHAAMSFVLVVVGVAILLYGTGTQGIGQFDSSQSAEKVARYKAALAGGAGVIAFCIAAGIIAFTDPIKTAFRIEQGYIRLQIIGSGINADDIGLYVPDVRVNGDRVPAVRRADRIEVYTPFLKKSQDIELEVNALLVLPTPTGGLLDRPQNKFKIILTKNGHIFENGVDRGRFDVESGYDFPKYQLTTPINLQKPADVSGFGVK